MSDWQDKSDFEINKAVAELLGFKVKVSSWSLAAKKEATPYSEFLKGDVYYIDTQSENIDLPDYCGNPSDAWPIILENKISMVYLVHGEYSLSRGIKNNAQHKNPLRAAMIVYLEMNNA